MDTSVTSMLVTAGVTAFAPWLTALVTAAHAHQTVKSGVTFVIALVTGVLVEWQADPAYDWQGAVLYATEGFAVATLTHLHMWKPVGLTGSTGLIQSRVPGGIGGGSRPGPGQDLASRRR